MATAGKRTNGTNSPDKQPKEKQKINAAPYVMYLKAEKGNRPVLVNVSGIQVLGEVIPLLKGKITGIENVNEDQIVFLNQANEEIDIWTPVENLPKSYKDYIIVRFPEPNIAVFYQEKTFASANAASPFTNFYIYPKDIVERLAKSLLERKFTLLFGHRQSGKTTVAQSTITCLQSISRNYQIPGHTQSGFAVYYVSFQTGIEFKNKSSFWWSLCESLKAMYDIQFDLHYDRGHASSNTFQSFFSKERNPMPVILFIDEASMLYEIRNKDDGIIEDFIGALRSLKDNYANSSLHSVVLVGTESVREVLGSRRVEGRSIYSPFTEEGSYQSTRFTQNEVQDLLNQFVAVKKVHLDVDEIANDIYEITLGHKGLVGICGHFIEEKLLSRSRTVSLKDWKANSFNLESFIIGKPTYSSIMQGLRFLGPEHRNILGNVLRYGYDAVKLDSAVKFLLAEGMCIRVGEHIGMTIIQCGAPILSGMMLSAICGPGFEISEVPPDRRAIDVDWLLRQTIENLYVQHIFTEKTSNANGTPSEYSFQAEFVTTFKSILGSAYPQLLYRVLPEVKERDDNGNRRRRLDILICDSTLPKYGFELVVAADQANFDKHMENAHDYGDLHGCQMYLINLCTDDSLTDYFGDEWVRERVTPVHVLYETAGGKGSLIYVGKRIPVSIKSATWSVLFDVTPVNSLEW